MEVTYIDDNYSIDRINTEWMGFLNGGDAWSFVYEQRDRKGVMIKAWQVWLQTPEDVFDYLDDLGYALKDALLSIGRRNWMVRV